MASDVSANTIGSSPAKGQGGVARSSGGLASADHGAKRAFGEAHHAKNAVNANQIAYQFAAQVCNTLSYLGRNVLTYQAVMHRPMNRRHTAGVPECGCCHLTAWAGSQVGLESLSGQAAASALGLQMFGLQTFGAVVHDSSERHSS
jgi:hypothetical protein